MLCNFMNYSLYTCYIVQSAAGALPIGVCLGRVCSQPAHIPHNSLSGSDPESHLVLLEDRRVAGTKGNRQTGLYFWS